jgi:phosphinothricin acetyltransferase
MIHKLAEIRAARQADCKEMLEIYAPFVETTAVTFELETPDLLSFEARFRQVSAKYPWLVYTENEIVLGYAYAASYRERKAYQWSVETSVYLSPNTRGKGIARMLYSNLMQKLSDLGYFTAYAIITLPNEASCRFHEKFGFENLAIFPEAGYKLGGWHNVRWMRYKIRETSANPAEPALPE